MRKQKTNYATAGGSYEIHKKVPTIFHLMEFSTSEEITWDCHVDSNSLTERGYDMIIGQDNAIFQLATEHRTVWQAMATVTNMY